MKPFRLLTLCCAVMLALSACSKKSEPKVLTVKPRPEISVERDALVVTGTAAAPADRPRGQARLMAERAAKLDALRQLAAVTGELRAQAITRGVQLDVEGFVQGAQPLSVEWNTNGVARVTLLLPLNGPGGVAGALGCDRVAVETIR